SPKPELNQHHTDRRRLGADGVRVSSHRRLEATPGHSRNHRRSVERRSSFRWAAGPRSHRCAPHRFRLEQGNHELGIASSTVNAGDSQEKFSSQYCVLRGTVGNTRGDNAGYLRTRMKSRAFCASTIVHVNSSPRVSGMTIAVIPEAKNARAHT